jgi:hypothetical protein
MKLIFKIILTIIACIMMVIFHIIGIIWTFKLNPYIGCNFKNYDASTQSYNDWWKAFYLIIKNKFK